LLCNGTEVRKDGEFEDLFNLIGYSYGINPGSQTIGPFGAYTLTSANVLTTTLGAALNTFLKVGSYVKIRGFVVNDGPDINGAILLITTAPANNVIGGTVIGNFVPPINVAGSGNAGFPIPPLSLMERWSFPVPDLRLASPIGAGTGIALASTGGSASTTITANNLPSHQHGQFQPGGRALSAGSGNLCGDFNVDANLRTIAGETYVENGSNSGAVVQNLPISTRNPYVAMNYIIKAET
jgi:microcystin-dependent protein